MRTANSSPPRRVAVSQAADAAVQAPRDLLQHRVALGVAERVVDVLEVVEVEEDHRERRAAAPAARQRLLDAVAQQHAVREAGERVVAGLVQQPALERLAVADVAGVQDDALDRAVADEVRRQRLDVDPAAARVADAVLDVARGALLEVREEPLQAGLIIGVDELPPVHALGAGLVQADEPQRGGADVEDDPVGVDDAHDVGGVAHERAEPRLEPVAEVGLGELLVLADEVGDPQQHEQEDDAGRDADDHVAGLVQHRLGDRHGRCDEARDGEHREARARQPRPAALGGR